MHPPALRWSPAYLSHQHVKSSRAQLRYIYLRFFLLACLFFSHFPISSPLLFLLVTGPKKAMHFCQTLSEFSPPKPTFTEKDLPDLSGKVYFITGATSGIGLCLAKILYSKNAKIYITSRSDTSAEKAISQIRDSDKASRGEVKHVVLDLSDLPTIAPAIKKFLAQEPLLHSVWYNAGVMNVPKGSISAQGYELHWGTNVVAHFIINKLLMPALISAAHVSPKGSVRAVWVSSDGHAFSPSGDGIDWKDITTKKSTGWKGEKGSMTYYGQSKAGNVILAMEEAKRYGKSDILSVVSKVLFFQCPRDYLY